MSFSRLLVAQRYADSVKSVSGKTSLNEIYSSVHIVPIKDKNVLQRQNGYDSF